MKYMIECWQEDDTFRVAIGRRDTGQAWHFLSNLPESGWHPSPEGQRPAVLSLPIADVQSVTFTPLSRTDRLLEVRRQQAVSKLREVLESLENKE